jgi:hypothetical protein
MTDGMSVIGGHPAPPARPALTLGIKTSTRTGTIIPRLSMAWTVGVAAGAVLEALIGGCSVTPVDSDVDRTGR